MKVENHDFAPRTAVYWFSRATTSNWLMLLVAVIVLSVTVLIWTEKRGQLAQQQVQLQSLQDRLELRAVSPVSTAPQLSAKQIQLVAGGIRQLNQPWGELLNALEDSSSAKVALIELRFDPALRQLRGAAECRSVQHMVTFVRQLRAQPLFASVEILAHQINETDKNRPYRFEFSARWREEGQP